jgi:hypothetical protein
MSWRNSRLGVFLLFCNQVKVVFFFLNHAKGLCVFSLRRKKWRWCWVMTKEAHNDWCLRLSEVSSSFSFQFYQSVSCTSFRSLLLQIDPHCEAKLVGQKLEFWRTSVFLVFLSEPHLLVRWITIICLLFLNHTCLECLFSFWTKFVL